jgi:hypothetical protein
MLCTVSKASRSQASLLGLDSVGHQLVGRFHALGLQRASNDFLIIVHQCLEAPASDLLWCELWPSWLCDATPVMCGEGLAKCVQVMWERVTNCASRDPGSQARRATALAVSVRMRNLTH